MDAKFKYINGVLPPKSRGPSTRREVKGIITDSLEKRQSFVKVCYGPIHNI